MQWLYLPAAAQLRASAILINKLITDLGVPNRWPQLIEDYTDILNPSKYDSIKKHGRNLIKKLEFTF